MSKIIKNAAERGSKIIEPRKILSRVGDTPDHGAATDALLENARMEADLLLDDARSEHQRIQESIQTARREWEKERERLMEEAYNEGYLLGEQEGKQAGYNAYTGIIDEANRIVEHNRENYYSYIERAEKVILSLGVKCAGTIIQQELEDEERFIPFLQRGLKEVRDLPEVRIHIHPSRHPLLMEHKSELEAMFPAEVQLFVYANDDLDPMECYMETKQGRIVLSVDSQLEELKRKLLERMEEEG
ncbi:flagellar assembly protein FliH [Rossellomorea marisflavi]|uniref:flagellar assembly protein FliH n=1 Tax=Rossellomorea marisflavi TaxID=189381 RepID=UPI00064F6F50|nr:flagellar assembly protein FliH [Rossellomorea marisflavi]KML06442.1 hypothetical protein VL06_10125 [Rossellomorea marisflavi]